MAAAEAPDAGAPPAGAPGGELARITDLGDLLVASDVAGREVVDRAREAVEQQPGRGLAEVLREIGVCGEAMQESVARAAGLALERIDREAVGESDLVEKLGVAVCRELQVIPLRLQAGRVVLGVVDPDDLIAADEVRHKLGRSVHCVVVSPDDLAATLDDAGRAEAAASEAAGPGSLEELMAGTEEDDIEVVETKEENLDLEKMAGESPVIRYVNYLIFNAVKEGASDIHIEPQEKSVTIRYRIDGVLYDTEAPPASMKAAILSRIKIMANLDIAERRVPQDGRIRAMVHGRKLDLRVSTLPMVAGEKAVLRILDTRSIQVELDDLGMSPEMLKSWTLQVQNPHGIVLVTGPTGSGKTTTLYASLGKMDRKKLNISTAEDPVEYHLAGINQTPVNAKIGMSFAGALRALLRQDPDVIMVGEIRDLETAKTAIAASMTGHLVLSTLHTNDAPSTVTRLINIGVEPFLVGSAVNACLAQRLVRRICEHCKTPYETTPERFDQLSAKGHDPASFFMGGGCEKCRGTGYSGRVGIYEMLLMNDDLRDTVAGNPNAVVFRQQCVENGMTTLRSDGFEKVKAGRTTVEEILRVTDAVV
ncbi:type IV pilus assembly protein PilB [Phycisphaera mikurensis NBRC 102666]|uniref:Type IV pilus assembly protein PilB n=1 Tax=Phycisphaera mikurensis (strain NBRC 102666 / KCTC 22515 / FYK2301M01) TaxID=1142394 RepID=I0IHW6_PHYMF|nr:type IV pilus assembly protein PilB [Phycisphaera mikurensis NBRC 102666]